MQVVFKDIHKASRIDILNVLIVGESGTGKELAAKAIHYNGLKKNGPFIAIACSAFSKGNTGKRIVRTCQRGIYKCLQAS